MSRRASSAYPELGASLKLFPQDIAGMIGLPYVGNVFYVDPSAGSDTANSGTSQDDALATVAAAYAKCTSGQHDVVIIAPTGGTGRTTETAGITWAKRFTHLIGSAAPIQTSVRSGMGFSSAVVSPCFTVSENGCIFKNVTFATSADINVMLSVTGDYNYFGNCHIQGSTNATAGDDTAWRALSLSAAEENLFEGCTIGIDTFERSAANASVELASASTRNIFRNCLFPVHADAATPIFVRAASAADVDRFALFQNCIFHNAVYSASTTLTTGMVIHAAVGGSIILDGCSILGATDWSDNYTAVTGSNMPDITAANAGFMETIAT